MKRTLSLVLALVMVLGTFTSVFAAPVDAEVNAGELLEQLGVLEGNLAGDLGLGNVLERKDAVVLLSRLMGEEDQAKVFPGAEELDYEDLENADPFYLPYLAWAKANGTFLGHVGHEGVRFGYEEVMTVQQYLNVVLRALEYEVDYDDVMDTAVELGLVEEGLENDAELTRGAMALITKVTLETKIKDSDETLAERLEIEMPVDESAVLSVKDIDANSAKSFLVKFNKAVVDEDEVTFEVTRGASEVKLTVEYDEDAKEATLSRTTTLAVGEYNVKVFAEDVEMASETINITEQKLSKIEITSNLLAVSQDGKGYATYVAYDQYDTDVTSTYHAFNIKFMTGAGNVTHKDGIITIDPLANTNLIALPNVAITGYDSTTGISVSATLKPSLSVGTLTSFELLPEEEIEVTAGDTTKVTYIPFKALDASGNETKNYEQIKEGLILTGDNKDSLTVTNNWVSVTLVQDPKNSKNAAIKVVATSNTPGNMIVNIPFNITAMTKNGSVSTVNGSLVPAPSVDKFVLLPPEEVVAKNEKAVVPFEAYDANGNRLYREAEIAEYVQLSENLGTYTKVDGTMYLRTKDTLTQDIVVTSMVKKNGQFSSVTVRVQDAAKAESLSVAGISNALEVGVVKNFGFGYWPHTSVGVKDQYGRDLELVLGQYDYEVKVSGGDDIVSITNNFGDENVITKGKSGISVKALKKGSTTLKFELYSGTEKIDTKVVPVTVVNTSDVVNYTVAPWYANVYAGGSAWGTGFRVAGKTVSGSTVDLSGATTTANPVNVTDFVGSGASVYAKESSIGYVAKDSETDVNVSVFHNNRVTSLTTSITSSTVKPVATSIGFGVDDDEWIDNHRRLVDDVLTMSVADFGNLTNVSDFSPGVGYSVNDSYGRRNLKSETIYKIVEKSGIDITVESTGKLTVNNTVNNSVAANDYFVISAITGNGLVKTIKVQAVENLVDLLEPSEEDPVDLTDYNAVLAAVEELVEEDYIPETWEALQTALVENAVTVENTQDDVDEAVAAIELAIGELVEVEEPSDELTATVTVDVAEALPQFKQITVVSDDESVASFIVEGSTAEPAVGETLTVMITNETTTISLLDSEGNVLGTAEINVSESGVLEVEFTI